MKTVFNLAAVGAVAALVMGRIKLKTALIIGLGAIMLANTSPTSTSNTSTSTN